MAGREGLLVVARAGWCWLGDWLASETLLELWDPVGGGLVIMFVGPEPTHLLRIPTRIDQGPRD